MIPSLTRPILLSMTLLLGASPALAHPPAKHEVLVDTRDLAEVAEVLEGLSDLVAIQPDGDLSLLGDVLVLGDDRVEIAGGVVLVDGDTVDIAHGVVRVEGEAVWLLGVKLPAAR